MTSLAVHTAILAAIRDLPADDMQPIAGIETQLETLLTQAAALEAGDATAWDDIEAVADLLVEHITGADAWTGSRYSLQKRLQQLRPAPASFIPTGF
jgi:hypothetical protein